MAVWEPLMGVMEYAEISQRNLQEGKINLSKFKGYFYSEKIDGWHVIWNGKDRLYTKSGKISFPVPDYLLKLLPKGVPISAELVLRRKQATEVAKLRNNPDLWKEARLYAFDLPAEHNLPFHTRTDKLKRVVIKQCKKHAKCPLRYIEQKTIGEGNNGISDFLRDFNNIVKCTNQKRTGECFGEGVVVTNPESLYQTDRRASLETRFKLKKRDDAEAKVVGYKEGKSLIVDFQGETFNLGIGLTDAQRSNMSYYFPKGSFVKFSFRGIGVNGIPKEARVLGRRYKEDMKLTKKTDVK